MSDSGHQSISKPTGISHYSCSMRIHRSRYVRYARVARVKKGEVTTAASRRDGPHTPAGAPGPSDKTTHTSTHTLTHQAQQQPHRTDLARHPLLDVRGVGKSTHGSSSARTVARGCTLRGRTSLRATS